MTAAELSPLDVHNLMLFKMRYSLTGIGFSDAEARRLIFIKWLAQRRGETPQRGTR